VNVTSVIPKSNEHWLELRANNINSTEIAALFGCSPYMTAFELWHLKSGNLKSNFKENERMTWGKRLQDPIAYGVAEDQGWKIRKRDDYMYSPDLRIGSSFDFAVVDSNPLNGDAALLEIKNVDSLAFKNGWEQLDDGSLDAPLHIELQCAHQMMIADINKLYLVAFVGGNTPVILERDRHSEFERKILQKVSEFWESVKSGVEPSPDFVKDSDAIKDLYSTSSKGKFVEGTPRAHVLAEKYSFLNESIAALEKEKLAVKSELLTIMGDAEKMIGSNFTVSAGMTMRSEYVVKPATFRNFRLSYKGE
jgi:putative phage-type endonuclease